MSARKGVYAFTAFGKGRRSIHTIGEILSAVNHVKNSQNLQSEQFNNAFWMKVCQYLGISLTKSHIRRLKQTYTQQQKHNVGIAAAFDHDLQSPSEVHLDEDIAAEPELDQVNQGDPEHDGGSSSVAEHDAWSNSDQPNTEISTLDGSSTPSVENADDREEFFSRPVPQKPCFFFIKEQEWNSLRRKQLKNRFKTLNWTSVMANGIRTLNPFCSFAFKRHTVKAVGSKRTGPLFFCNGYCTFKECPVKVTVTMDDETSLKATVNFSGDKVWHSTATLKRRHVRGDDRATLAEALSTKLPRSFHLDKIGKLDDSVIESGCRDLVPTTGTMKTLSWEMKKKTRRHSNDSLSLEIMHEEEQGSEDAIIQKIIMIPKGVMLWSKQMLALFYQRCKQDIIYLDATGSIIQKEMGKSAPFYVYELVVRHPLKGSSPVPVATFLTSDHTTASVSFFLASFVTDLIKHHGPKTKSRPVMVICDGSIVLLQSLAHNFCGVSLQELLVKYHRIVTGQAQEESLKIPILHRCLSHIMKNAKDLCKKHSPKHYHLAMHTFGAMTQAQTMEELDEVFFSATVVFSSAYCGDIFEKHFKNLQVLLSQKRKCDLDESCLVEEDFQNDVGPTPFQKHFEALRQRVEVDEEGEPNPYLSLTFIPQLLKFFLPQAVLWTGLLLGNLGRHGTGPVYDKFSKKFNRAACKETQNYTQDNQTQGIMEKSQWDLKRIRFQRRRLTRLDDFVATYKNNAKGLLREFKDSFKQKHKRYFVDIEKWKQRRQKKRGIYVRPLMKPFVQQKKRCSDTTTQMQTTTKENDDEADQDNGSGQFFDTTTQMQTTTKEKADQEKGSGQCAQDVSCSVEALPNDASQLLSLWEKEDTEVVVSEVPFQIKGQSCVIHHSELRSLRPHQWLTGEIIESYIHLTASKLDLGSTLYILNHYIAGVILFGKREEIRRHSFKMIDFDSYQGIMSFVNTDNVHWKLLYIDAVKSKVYLVDPAKSESEMTDSEMAAKRVRDYFKMRWTCYSRPDWVGRKWKGAVLKHPFQKDGNSCGVIVAMMSKCLMEAYPDMPNMDFKTSKKHMAQERQNIGLEILQASVFNTETNCSMCSEIKPPGTGSPFTNWIQCDICSRWFHAWCVKMDKVTFEKAKTSDWNCCLCS